MKIITCRQLGGIGDCLALTPVFRGLREKYPRAKIMHVTGSVYLSGATMDVFTHVPKRFIDEIHFYEPWDGCLPRTREVWAEHYADCPHLEDDPWIKRADLVFDLNTPCVEHEWPALHSPEGIQKPRYQIWAEFCGVDPSSYKPMYEITKKEAAWAAEYFKEKGLNPARCVALATSACDKRRAVPVDKIHEICTRLKDAGLIPVIIDPTFSYPDFAAINGKRVSEIMALLSLMAVAVSGDSGLLHMAGTVGTPVVSVFGPTDPDMRMKPYIGSAVDARQLVSCSPCWYNYPCLQTGSRVRPFTCINKVSADVIVEEVLRWYAGGRRRLRVI